jgi:Ca-activated chloride channel homolog
MIQFANQTWLWMLWLIPAAIGLYQFYRRWRKARLLALGTSSVIRRIVTDRGSANHHLKFMLQLMVFALLVVAVARPQIAGKIQKKSIKGDDVIICLDVSNSMMSEDIRPNRLIRAKQAINTLLKQLDEEQVGLVVFAGEAFIQVPLTIDKAATAMLLNTISVGDITNQGTAIADAINLAVRAFGSDPLKGGGKTIILVTDGEDHEGSVLEEAKLAAEQGIKIFTLGLGSPNGVPVPLYKNGVLNGYRKDEQGNTVLSAMNPQLLASVAEVTGGKFYLSQNLTTAMQRIVTEIRKQPSGKRLLFRPDQAEDQFQWFAMMALVLLAIERVIPYRSKGRRLIERLDRMTNSTAINHKK